jgi:23S rRNA pseudouridine1911/1915/1917 synthase
LLSVQPKTGRTHQIRLHLAHIGCPVLCDRLYGGHANITRGQLLRRRALGLPPRPEDDTIEMERQALHAHRLEFSHPKTGQTMSFCAPLPADFERVLTVLREQTG